MALSAALVACGDADRATDPGSSSTSAAQPPECPPAPSETEPDPIDEPDADASDQVPADATSVRLCQGVGTAVDGAGDLLTSQVQDVADAVNGLKATTKPDMCTADMGPGFRLVFGYADGTTFVASGKTYGCRELVVGSGYRTPAPRALAAFRKLAG